MAQLVARLYGIEEVASSNLAGSIFKKNPALTGFFMWCFCYFLLNILRNSCLA